MAFDACYNAEFIKIVI